jgi:hypothetical protein
MRGTPMPAAHEPDMPTTPEQTQPQPTIEWGVQYKEFEGGPFDGPIDDGSRMGNPQKYTEAEAVHRARQSWKRVMTRTVVYGEWVPAEGPEPDAD